MQRANAITGKATIATEEPYEPIPNSRAKRQDSFIAEYYGSLPRTTNEQNLRSRYAQSILAKCRSQYSAKTISKPV